MNAHHTQTANPIFPLPVEAGGDTPPPAGGILSLYHHTLRFVLVLLQPSENEADGRFSAWICSATSEKLDALLNYTTS